MLAVSYGLDRLLIILTLVWCGNILPRSASLRHAYFYSLTPLAPMTSS